MVLFGSVLPAVTFSARFVTARAETPEQGIALGARVHGVFGAFIPLGIKIGTEKSPPGTATVIVIRPRQGGAGFKYAIAMTAPAHLGLMNKDLDPRGRYNAVMAVDGLFQVEPVQ